MIKEAVIQNDLKTTESKEELIKYAKKLNYGHTIGDSHNCNTYLLHNIHKHLYGVDSDLEGSNWREYSHYPRMKLSTLLKRINKKNSMKELIGEQ